MKSKRDLLIIFIGSASAAFLAFASHYLKNYVIDFSGNNLFGFGFSGLLYIFVPIAFFFLGMVATSIFLRIKTLKNSLLISIVFALIVSLPSIREVFAIYFGFENFTKIILRRISFKFVQIL